MIADNDVDVNQVVVEGQLKVLIPIIVDCLRVSLIPRYVRVGAIIVEEKMSTLESLVVNRPPEGGLSEGVAVVDDGQV